jgi:hypothetical protein
MRNLLTLIVLIVIVGVGLGVYLGWFRFSSHDDRGQTNLTLSVDKDKIEAVRDTVVGNVEDLEHKTTDRVPSPPR